MCCQPLLMSASYDGTVRAWCASMDPSEETLISVSCLFVLEFGQRNPVADMAFLQSETLLTCSWDGCLRTIDLVRRSCRTKIQASESGLRAICVQEGCDLAFVGSDDGTVSGWQPLGNYSLIDKPTPIVSWRAHLAQVIILRCWKKWLLSTSEDRTIKVWEGATYKCVDKFAGYGGAVLALCVSQQDSILWTGTRDFLIHSWDLTEAQNRAREQTQMTKADADSWHFRQTEILAARERKKKLILSKTGKGRARSSSRRR